MKFAERYKDKKEGEFNLRVSDGKSYSVQYFIRRQLNGSIRGEICCGGWKVFARDNHLEVGDVCIFKRKKESSCLRSCCSIAEGGVRS